MKRFVLGLLTGYGPLVPLLVLAALGGLIFLVTAPLARYMAGMVALYRSATATRGTPDDAGNGTGNRRALRRAVAGFALGAAALVVLTPLLVLSADALSTEAQITATFVGTLLVGLSTSLPELAATIFAVRMGALDLAAGNVFGSVTFNLLIFVFLDAAYVRGPLVEALSRDHLVSVLVLVVSLALALMAMLPRVRQRPSSGAVESPWIVVAYVLRAWLLYRLGQ